MPGSPAVPKNSAHSDQPKAARVPTDTSVSIVDAPWRRLVTAARWKGQPPYPTTGAVNVSASHCQLVNCNAGTIDSTTTGTASPTDTHSRVHSGSTVVGPAGA